MPRKGNLLYLSERNHEMVQEHYVEMKRREEKKHCSSTDRQQIPTWKRSRPKQTPFMSPIIDACYHIIVPGKRLSHHNKDTHQVEKETTYGK